MQKILIITGGSKGIGNGIIDAYQKQDFQIYSISRTINEHYPDVAQIQFDLGQSNGIAQCLSSIFEKLDPQNIEKITLINNAGTIGQIAAVENIGDMEQTIKLNTLAPMLLTATFIQLSKHWPAKKTIINISSGAANKPYHGWSIYGASKAALDQFTKTVALEQDDLPNGTKAIGVYPGVVDTSMQAQIRKSEVVDFPSIDRFVALKETGALANQQTVGQAIFAIDHDPQIENGALIRVEPS